MDCKLLSLPGAADTYILLMNTWNTLPESYQQRVSNNTLATVKCQIQQAENPTHALVISMETAPIDYTIRLDYLTSKVALEEPVIGSADPNTQLDNNCMDDKIHFGIQEGSRDYADEGDESDMHDAIPTTSQ